MNISVGQFVLILLYLCFYTYESRSSETLFLYSGAPVVGGFITGLICGEVTLGLSIGATLQLMNLGVAEFGGVSIPDYHVGAVVGTMICAMTGKNLEYALPIAISVAMLMVQLDVLARMAIAFFINQSRRQAEKLNIKSAYIWNIISIVTYMLRHCIPVIIVFAVGGDAITAVLNALPKVVMGAFSVASKLLPAMGTAVLLRYMAVKENFAYLLIGFALVAYLKVPILGLAIIATGFALMYYKTHGDGSAVATKGGADDDEL